MYHKLHNQGLTVFFMYLFKRMHLYMDIFANNLAFPISKNTIYL